MKTKKPTPWWAHLLWIPLQLILAAVGVIAAVALDQTDSGIGMLAAGFVLAVMTGVVITEALYRAIGSLSKKAPSGLQCWLPFLMQAVLYTVLVAALGLNEINSFYARPDHVGFAIPVMSILLGVFLFIAGAASLLTGLYHFVKLCRAKARGKKEENQ